jgi:hypothetical protein
MLLMVLRTISFLTAGIATLVATSAYSQDVNRFWAPSSAGPVSFSSASWVDLDNNPASAPTITEVAQINVGNGTSDYAYIDGITDLNQLIIGAATGPGATSSGGLELRSGADVIVTVTGSTDALVNSIGGVDGVGYLRIQEGAKLSLAGRLYVGHHPGSEGHVTQDGGTLEINAAQPLVVGQLAGSTGTYTLNNGSITIQNRLMVGVLGTGEFIMNGGSINLPGTITTGYITLGPNAGGNGTMVINDGTITTSSRIDMGVAAGATGSLTVNGGTINITDYLQVARLGTGALTQTDGDILVNRVSTTGYGFVIAANGGDGVGHYTMSGGTLTVANTNLGALIGSTSGTGSATFEIVGEGSTISVGNDWVHNPSTIINLQIDNGISPVNVGRDLTLAGTLDVSFLATPTLGQTFTVFDYANALTGTFANFEAIVDSPLGAGTVELGIDYGSGLDSQVVLTVLSFIEESNLLGDYNNDKIVDALDYAAWKSSFGSTTSLAADGNENGVVDLADYTVWRDNLGATAPMPLAAPQSVPEPSTLACVAVGLFALASVRFRRR